MGSFMLGTIIGMELELELSWCFFLFSSLSIIVLGRYNLLVWFGIGYPCFLFFRLFHFLYFRLWLPVVLSCLCLVLGVSLMNRTVAGWMDRGVGLGLGMRA
jgi:hypothetical protein